MTAPVTANKASEVLVGKPNIAGGIYVGPMGSAVPKSPTEELGAAFKGVGYVVFGGVTQTIGATSTPLKAWGGSVVRTLQTEHNLTYAFGLMQTNKTNMDIYYGDGSTTGDMESGLTTKVTAAELNHSVWVIELRDGDYRGRITIEDGQITERGEVTYQDEDAVTMPVTVTCYESGAEAVKATIMWILDTGDDGGNGETVVAVTGVTAGDPGAFAPADATLPANLAALAADPTVGDAGSAHPGAEWDAGDAVVLGDGSVAYWDGSAWAAGNAPAH